MYTELNLAKDPFRNRSLFWMGMAAGYLVALVALALVLAQAGAVGADTQTMQLETKQEKEAVAALEAAIAAAKAERSRAVFGEQDLTALADARSLITMKNFSWTKLFNDIEPQVPPGARLTTIAIGAMTGEGASRVVEMVINGTGKDFGQMGAFIANLDRTGGRFLAEPVSNGQSGQGGDFQFAVRVTYRPGFAVQEPQPAPPAAGEEDADG